MHTPKSKPRAQSTLAILGSLACFLFSMYLALDVYRGYEEAEHKVLQAQRNAQKTRDTYIQKVQAYERKIARGEGDYAMHKKTFETLQKKVSVLQKERTQLDAIVRSLQRDFDKREGDEKSAQTAFENTRAMYENTYKDIVFEDSGAIQNRDSFLSKVCGAFRGILDDYEVCKEGKKAERHLRELAQVYARAQDTREKARDSLSQHEKKLNALKANLKTLADPDTRGASLETFRSDLNDLKEQKLSYIHTMRAEHGPLLHPETDLTQPIQGATLAEFFTVWHWIDAVSLWFLSIALGILMAVRAAQFLGRTSFYLVGSGPEDLQPHAEESDG